MVLDGEKDRVPVPHRLSDLRVRHAVAVERFRQDALRSRGDVDDRDLAVLRIVPASETHAAGHARAVRREARRLVPGVAAGQPYRLPSIRVDEVEVADELDVPVVFPRRRERDPPAVARPSRILILEVAEGELLRLARSVGRDHEDVSPPVADPADIVQLVLEPLEPPRRPAPLVLLGVFRVTDPRRERQPRSVGRPGDLGDVLLQVGQLRSFAARERKQVELPRLALPVGDEREASPVGRDARLHVELLPRGQATCLGAVERHKPDRAPVSVLLAVYLPYGHCR